MEKRSFATPTGPYRQARDRHHGPDCAGVDSRHQKRSGALHLFAGGTGVSGATDLCGLFPRCFFQANERARRTVGNDCRFRARDIPDGGGYTDYTWTLRVRERLSAGIVPLDRKQYLLSILQCTDYDHLGSGDGGGKLDDPRAGSLDNPEPHVRNGHAGRSETDTGELGMERSRFIGCRPNVHSGRLSLFQRLIAIGLDLQPTLAMEVEFGFIDGAPDVALVGKILNAQLDEAARFESVKFAPAQVHGFPTRALRNGPGCRGVIELNGDFALAEAEVFGGCVTRGHVAFLVGELTHVVQPNAADVHPCTAVAIDPGEDTRSGDAIV